MDLKAFYRDIILDHYRRPRNAKSLPDATSEARCKNPACGDRVTLQLKLSGDRIEDVGLQGVGCAISQASASMMTEAVKGASVDSARAKLREFRRMVVEGAETPDSDVLGELLTLQGVSKLHARVKCAMCGWSALDAALERRTEEVDLDLDSSMPEAGAGGNV